MSNSATLAAFAATGKPDGFSLISTCREGLSSSPSACEMLDESILSLSLFFPTIQVSPIGLASLLGTCLLDESISSLGLFLPAILISLLGLTSFVVFLSTVPVVFCNAEFIVSSSIDSIDFCNSVLLLFVTLSVVINFCVCRLPSDNALSTSLDISCAFSSTMRKNLSPTCAPPDKQAIHSK